jgi:polysaccharide biosynthesis transport protein
VAINGVKRKQQKVISSRNAVDIKEFFRMLLRRRFLILGVSGLVMLVTSVAAILAKPNYQSSMQLVVKSNSSTNVKTSNDSIDTSTKTTASNLTLVNYTTQLQMMLSNDLIEKSVAILHQDYPNLTIEDIKGKKDTKSPLNITRVNAKSDIDTDSQVFEIKYNNYDPIKTQRVLETLLKVYKDYDIEQERQQLSQEMTFVNERLPKVKINVTTAENKLEKFRDKHNILDPEAQSKIVLETLANTQKQLQNTRAQLQDVKARYTALQEKLETSPNSIVISSRLNQSDKYQTLLHEIEKTDLALTQERIRYTEDSPKVQKLVQQKEYQLSLLRQKITRTLADKTGKKVSQIKHSEIDKAVNQALNQSASSHESLLSEGQISEADTKLVEEMTQLQANTQGLEANEKSLETSENSLRSELAKYPALIAEYNRLLPEVQTNRKTLEQLMQAQQSISLKLAQSSFDWQVLEAPKRGVYTGSGRKLILTSGAIAAPIIGIVAALIVEMLTDSIYTLSELQRIANLRVLGIVPKLSPFKKRKRIKFPKFGNKKALAPDSRIITSLPSHENLDMAYQNIQILNPPLSYKSLMVTSACLGEGKSTITLGLAFSSARTHHRVLIIDANLREPSLHKFLQLQNDWGLSLLLIDEADSTFQDYVQPIHPSIDVLTAGPFLEDTVKLLSSQRMKELFIEFEQNYDLILVDAPPILTTVDARILATLCNAIVIVARLGQITRAELTQTKEILENLNLIGIIANQVAGA